MAIALRGVMAMVECELQTWEQLQKPGELGSTQTTSARLQHDVWERRAQKWVELAAAEVGRTDAICVRTALTL